MLKLIDNSTAFYGTGLALQRKLFKIRSGQYAGRIAAVYPSSPSVIVLSYADPPYISWSSPQQVVTDSADYPAGCWMDSNGNIYLAYTAETSLNLMHKKLSFADGGWTAGNAATIYNAGSNYYPSLFKDHYGRLWVSWTRVSGSDYTINVKSSVDDGVSWEFGPDDEGTILVTGQSSAFSRLEYLPTYLYCFYCVDGTSLAYRKIEMSGSLWLSEAAIFSGTGISDSFHTSVSDDLRIALAFASDGELYYKDFDGAIWSGNILIDSEVASAPIVRHNGSTAFVFYCKQIGPNQNQLNYAVKNGAEFASPSSVSGSLAACDRVICYRPEASAMYYDRSVEAADDSAADVYHPDSGGLLKDSGDALFLGQFEKFSRIYITLSTPGSGGTVTWHYWDGADWKNFVPVSGQYNFDSSPARIRLWEDSNDIPSDWQSSVIAGHSKFWIKVVVSSDFVTAPVGTQITAAVELQYMTAL
ncbi:MAG TPA: hypothetical protein ENO22_14345 [candidate division Zixibacteria bacterium]|nr:hypothetical protein [candidate division Zixibacteria bacterium]